MQYIHKHFLAFTLVELIVVITIVGILSTVGFVSYSGYLTGARDSNRFSQLTKLSDSLQVYAASKSLPLPDNYIAITASGASNVIAYQGYAGTDVLEAIDYTNGGIDPKDDGYFTNYVTKDRKNMQLLAFMEDNASISYKKNIEIFAADYSERFPKVYGRKLGLVTQEDTNTPAQEVSSIVSLGYLDIVNTTERYASYISNDEILRGTGAILLASNPNASCARLKQTGQLIGNGIYVLSTLGKNYQIYCDMEKKSYMLKNSIIYSGNSDYRGSFEEGLDSFASYGPVALFEVYPLESKVGDNSLFIRGGQVKLNGNNGGVLVNRQVPLIVGRVYTLEFWAKSLTGEQSINASFQSGSGNENCLSTGGIINTEWRKFSKTCTLNVDRNTIFFWTNMNGGEFLLDGVQLYEGNTIES